MEDSYDRFCKSNKTRGERTRGEQDDFELLEKIFEWAEQNPKFNTNFIESLRHHLERFGELSNPQREACENICEKWGIS